MSRWYVVANPLTGQILGLQSTPDDAPVPEYGAGWVVRAVTPAQIDAFNKRARNRRIEWDEAQRRFRLVPIQVNEDGTLVGTES